MPERGDGVYAPLVRSRSAGEPTPVLKGKADADAVVYSDGFGARAERRVTGIKSATGSGAARTRSRTEPTVSTGSGAFGGYAK